MTQKRRLAPRAPPRRKRHRPSESLRRPSGRTYTKVNFANSTTARRPSRRPICSMIRCCHSSRRYDVKLLRVLTDRVLRQPGTSLALRREPPGRPSPCPMVAPTSRSRRSPPRLLLVRGLCRQSSSSLFHLKGDLPHQGVDPARFPTSILSSCVPGRAVALG